MHTQQDRSQSRRLRENTFSPWIRLVFVVITILIIAIGTIIWIYLGPAADIIYAFFVGLSGVLTFFTVVPLLFSSQRSEENSGSQIFIQVPQIMTIPLLSLDKSKTVDNDQSILNRTTLPEEIRHTRTEMPHLLDSPSFIWNVPYQRNPFFTGREDILNQLHDTLRSNKAIVVTQPQAISGLGGIGKTQIAVEFTYRYRNDYQAILWAGAGSYESLATGFATFADLLNLPEKDFKNQDAAIFAVKHWLEVHDRWLLILDNADDLTIINDILPLGGRGHILLTTHAQATGGIAKQIEIQKMKVEEGALFLLRRTNNIVLDASLDDAIPAERIKAEGFSKAVDGLPLALDQAGAYIEETACGLTNYLDLYQTQQTKLLQRRGRLASDHPEPLYSTLKISFEKVKQANRTAAKLLQCFAFLYPDGIPEEIIIKGAIFIDWNLFIRDTPLKLDTSIEELRKYSLVNRDHDTKSLTIHRLVQAILKDVMSKRMQRKWAKRTVRILHLAFPDTDFVTWQKCQQYLQHAQVCAALIDQWNMKFHAAPCLLRKAGDYLLAGAEYTEAEIFYKKALAIFEKTLGPQKYTQIASSLGRLAYFYATQGKYVQAESFYQQALTAQKKKWGKKVPQEVYILR